jgi:hypothetical protein
MSVILEISSYLSALVVMAVVPAISQLLLFLVLFPLLSRAKGLKVVGSFIMATVGVLMGVYVVVWIASSTSLRASVTMVLVPAVLSCLNNRRRIQLANLGLSKTSVRFRSAGEKGTPDKALEVNVERACFAGDLTGYVVGLLTLVPDRSLF